MTYLLAQVADAPVQPTERQVMAAEEAATRTVEKLIPSVTDKLLSGVENAAAAEPVQYLTLLGFVALLVVVIIIARRTFTYLDEKERREDEARTKAAEEARAGREHTQAMADKFHSAQLAASSTCHEHSLAMMIQRNEGGAILKECVAELHGVTTDLKGAVKNIGDAAQDNRKTAESLLQMRQRPAEHT